MKLGVEIVGVSGDSVKTLGLFKKDRDLPYTLLADEKGTVAKALGVPTKAGAKGKAKMKDGTVIDVERGCFPGRWTIVIDKGGNIAHINPKAVPAQDAKKVQDIVKGLQK